MSRTDDDARMLELLERAVSDVTPRSVHPTDDVLARAARSPLARLSGRLRALLGAVVAFAAIGGGAYAFSTAGDPDEPAPSPPVTLDATLPAGWTYDDSGITVRCGTVLAPRTVYRGATVEDVTQCGQDELPGVTGPVLVVGTVSADAREALAVLGTPALVNGRAARVLTIGDSPVDVAVYALAGDASAGYLVAAPAGADVEPVGPSLQDGADLTVAAEALALTGQVRASGGAEPELVLPAQVSSVYLAPGVTGEGDDAPAYVRDPAAVERVLAALRPPDAFREGCPTPETGRSLWLQDASSGRWSRVVVTTAQGLCRTAWSELGGRGPVGDPLRVVRELDEGVAVPAVGPAAETVAAAGLSAVVPAGWDVARGPEFDPCTALRPTVVLGARVLPSCDVRHGARPHQPYLWLAPEPLERGRMRTDSGMVLAGDPTARPAREGGTVSWSDEELLDVGGVTLDGRLGVPERGDGRFLLVGLPDERAVAAVERLVGVSP
ncbi:hypothetical protein [Motilibacter deserti]|uniref:Uncharacterized protein n=1 Tax=Motilibacter deserti TaxID=2714956 RepID=A0ABX0GTS9_9ACTN|nr:hypothetical protein [Motilibacter deserti]NHC13070.1 hypothetical protein [Motilibacter deserti]